MLYFVALLAFLSTSSFGQVALPLSQLHPEIPEHALIELYEINFKVFDEHLFVGIDKNLWMMSKDGRQANKVESIEGSILSIQVCKDRLFIETGGKTGPALWNVNKDGKQASRVRGIAGRVYGYTCFGDHSFVNTYQGEGWWIIGADGQQGNRVDGIKGELLRFAVFDDQVFVVTDAGLWKISKGSTHALQISDRKDIQSVGLWRSELLIGTTDGLMIIKPNGAAQVVEGTTSRVVAIEAFDDDLFIATDGAVWITDKGITKVNKLAGSPSECTELTVIGDRLFVSTTEGLWILSRGNRQFTAVEGISDNISAIIALDRDTFVGTTNAGWILNSDGKSARKIESLRGQPLSLQVADRYVYLAVNDTLYQLDTRARIASTLTPTSWWGAFIGHILPSHWLPSEKVQVKARYSDESDKDPYGTTVRRNFRFAKAAASDQEPSEDKFSTEDQFSYEISWGNNSVHYWVKDEWGNTFEQKAVYRGVPSQYAFSSLPLLVSAVFVLSCLALAPKVRFCHSAIMNPWLRKYFSLGSVPLLLSVFPSLRRHVLRRYSSSVHQDKEFTEWKTRFVSPDEGFLAENFGKKLNDERRLLLTGQSGIGKTSFFKYLMGSYASRNGPSLPAKVFPVFISLTNYGSNSLEDLVYTQLFSYGAITDKELAPMFLEQGGLLIFLDGVNEVQNVADRQVLSEFVKKFGASNYVCLSSQQTYPEIENIPRIALKTFSKEKVCEFIKQRVNDKANSEEVIKRLTEEDYQLYSVPRDLEFAIEILNSGENLLPKSRTALYRKVFALIFASWKEEGNFDAEAVLCQRAYAMVVERDLAFDSVDHPKLKEITTDLAEQKFLVRRENTYNFRHDLIRSYLASEYFYPRWPKLLEGIGGKQIDSNWLEMLKFSCENIGDPAEVRSLVFELLEKSVRKDLAKSLFEWLKISHPSKCESWETTFYTNYGAMDFK